MNKQKLLKKLLSGSRNIRFSEAMSCAQMFGFVQDRLNGSHHIFINPNVPELLNIQNVNGKAKPYQIRQLLKIIEKYNLKIETK